MGRHVLGFKQTSVRLSVELVRRLEGFMGLHRLVVFLREAVESTINGATVRLRQKGSLRNQSPNRFSYRSALVQLCCLHVGDAVHGRRSYNRAKA